MANNSVYRFRGYTWIGKVIETLKEILSILSCIYFSFFKFS